MISNSNGYDLYENKVDNQENYEKRPDWRRGEWGNWKAKNDGAFICT